jgi:hypothetical protein
MIKKSCSAEMKFSTPNKNFRQIRQTQQEMFATVFTQF